jgi:hypothetical protein
MTAMRGRVTLVQDYEIHLDNYEGVTEEDANAAGIELPIDTVEKAVAYDEWAFKNGDLDIYDLIDLGDKSSVSHGVVEYADCDHQQYKETTYCVNEDCTNFHIRAGA